MVLRPRKSYASVAHQTKEVTRFAFLPTRMRRSTSDNDGEIIWFVLNKLEN